MQKKQRQQQSSQVYSPEYSSPFSSQSSILQARFSHQSPENRRDRYGKSSKENFIQKPLPVFQEIGSCNAQMIAHVTLPNSESENGYVNAILSDLSDDNLIKQLQLDINGKNASVAFTNSSNLVYDHSGSQTNKVNSTFNSPEFTNIEKKKYEIVIPSGQPASPLKQTFVNGQSQRHVWKQTANLSAPTSRPSNAYKLKTARPETARCIRVEPVQEKTAGAPVPHPYPFANQACNSSQVLHPHPFTHQTSNSSMPPEIGNTSRSNTIVTKVKELSPAISQEEERFKAYIHTDSDERLERLVQWSASPTIKCGDANQDNHKAVVVRGFDAPSTIEEQFTQEMLQASATATMIQFNNMGGQHKAGIAERSSTMGHYMPRNQVPIQEPQIMMQQYPSIHVENQGGDSESLEQIKLISQAMQRNFPSNYSPERDPDASSSLKDFSDAENGIYFRCNDYQGAPMMLDFDQPKAHTHRNQMYQSQLSMNAFKDGVSACLDVRPQQPITHYIQTDLQQLQNEENRISGQFSQLRKQASRTSHESTLINEKSNVSVNNSGHSKQFMREQEQKQVLSQQTPVLTRQPQPMSPVRQRIYGQAQMLCTDLYKPVLRQSANGKNNGRSGRNSSAKLDKTVYTGKTEIQTPQKPTFISPGPPQNAPTVTNRFEQKNTVRRNLEQQLLSVNNSLSPVLPERATNVKSTILAKFDNMARDLKKLSTTIQTDRKSPSPVPRVTIQNQTIRPHFTTIQADTRKSFGVKTDFTSSGKSPQPQIQMHDNATLNFSRSTSNKNIEAAQKLAISKVISQSKRAEKNHLQRTSSHIYSSIQDIKCDLGLKSRPVTVRPNKPNESSISTQQAKIPAHRSPTPRQTLNSMTSRTAFEQPQLPIVRPSLPQQPQMKASAYQIRRAAETLKGLDIEMFLELERIKKPQAAILAIARMSCIFFESLRNRDAVKMDQVERMQSWQQIQEYMRSQLTCCVPELRTLLKQKLVILGRINCIDGNELPRETEIECAFYKIWDNFFTESKIRVIRRFVQTSRLMRNLVHLVYAFVCLTLNLEREFSFDNLLGLTEQPQTRIEDLKQLFQPSQTSLASQNHTMVSKEVSFNKTSQGALSREKSLEAQALLIEENNSPCSKCSCRLKQANSGQISRSKNLDKSATQNSIDMHMQVYQTLEGVFVEESSIRSRQVSQKDNIVQSSLSNRPSRPQDEKYQMPRSHKTKHRSSVNSEDLETVMTKEQTIIKTSKHVVKSPAETFGPAQSQFEDASQTCRGTSVSNRSRPMLSKQKQLKSKDQRREQSKESTRGPNQRRKRQPSVLSARSEFSSVVRVSGASANTPDMRLTPKSGKTLQKTTEQTKSPINTCATLKPNIQQRTEYGLRLTRKIKKQRQDVSPVTPTNLRNLQKSASSLSFVSSMKLSNVPYVHQVEQNQHQRNISTLHKSTASATAKLRACKPTSISPLQRDVSVKEIKLAANTQTKLQTRKTKSQTNIKAFQQKKQTIPKESIEQQVTSHSKKQIARKSIAALRKKDFKDIASHTHRQFAFQSPRAADTQEFQARFLMAHPDSSFGLNQLSTEDRRRLNQMMTTTNEDQRRNIASFDGEDHQEYTKRTRHAPLQSGSFTPEKNNFMSLPESSLHRTPLNNQFSMSPCAAEQTTGQLGKQQSVETIDDTTQEASCSYIIERAHSKENRTSFLMQHAKAITENINSCYKEHNMPQIDMTTIEKLKMRRMNFMKQVCAQEDKRILTQQSCNVVTTVTVEQTISSDASEEKQRQPEKDVTFRDALNKLKAEVAILMDQRIQKTL